MAYRRIALDGAVLGLLTACAGGAPAATETTETPEPPAFDVAAVRSNFTATCTSPVADEVLMCQQIEAGSMTAEGDILYVPTGLNPANTDQADAICSWIALLHFDGDTAEDLGYRFVGILDKDGGNAAACSVG